MDTDKKHSEVRIRKKTECFLPVYPLTYIQLSGQWNIILTHKLSLICKTLIKEEFLTVNTLFTKSDFQTCRDVA